MSREEGGDLHSPETMEGPRDLSGGPAQWAGTLESCVVCAGKEACHWPIWSLLCPFLLCVLEQTTRPLWAFASSFI